MSSNTPRGLNGLRRALAGLPEPSRTMLLAHQRDGQSYAEIARLHGVPVEEVEHQIAAALGRLLVDLERPSVWRRLLEAFGGSSAAMTGEERGLGGGERQARDGPGRLIDGDRP